MKLKRTATLIVLLSVSVAINTLQGRRIRLLQNEIERLAAQDGTLVGTVVPPLTVLDLQGHQTTIKYESNSTVLYIFSPSCEWCRQNSQAIRSLTAQIGVQYNIVGLSLDDEGLQEFVQANEMPFPVFTGLSELSRKAYQLRVTPETLVIAPGGSVVQAWKGAFRGATKEKIERYFSARLPEGAGTL